MDIHFVTGNANKVREAESILKIKLKRTELDLPEIQTVQVEEVVKDKAHRAYDAIKKPVMVEDTGLYVTAWKGFPGALIKWVLDSIGIEGICKILGNYDRTTVAKTCVCLYNGKEYKTFIGEVKGQIVESPRGTTNFGWDPCFQPDGFKKTFAEIPQEEKDKISMRKIAFTKAKEFLDKNPGFAK